MAQEVVENASLVWLKSSLLLIAQKVVERSARKVGPTTLFSWTRQFRLLGDYFKRDGRGVRQREWILSEEDLEMDLINWLKAQKRVTTKNTHVFVNTVLLVREGGLLLLAKYALTLCYESLERLIGISHKH